MPYMISVDNPQDGQPWCEPYAVGELYDVNEALIRYSHLGLLKRRLVFQTLERDKIVEIAFPADEAKGRFNVIIMELTKADIVEMSASEYAKLGTKFGRL